MTLRSETPLMRIISVLSGFLLFTASSLSQNVETIKIWDKGTHNAFTDLIHFKSYFYCTFREGISHVPKDPPENGKIRIIRSADGLTWESVALLSSRRYDLRDPKLSVTPENKLMVLMGGSCYIEGELISMMPHVSFSTDGSVFSDLVPVTIDSSIRTNYDWIWRITWNGANGYAVVYQTRLPGNISKVRLLHTNDGISFGQLTDFEIESLPNEATIRFDKDYKMLILLRREAKANGMLGSSSPPYQEWTWKELNYRLGGPNFIIAGNNKMVVGTRLYEPESTTTIIYLTDMEGNIQKKLQLPSGGDTSYPGLLIYKKHIWVSYYSSHEGKTCVYLAKIRMNDLLKV